MSYSSNESLHALSGAYVVDALDDDERAAFEEHLRGCSDCQAEVTSLREAAALMADDSAMAPPPGLRDSVLSGIATVRPLPPEKPATAEVEDTASVVVPMRRSRRFRIASLAVAAAVLAVLTFGAVTQPWNNDNGREPSISAVAQVRDAPDVEKTSMDFVDGSNATVYRSRSQGKAAIVTHRMATPPNGKVYELWLQDETGHMSPAGLMPRSGNAEVVLKGDASQATGVGITVEPEGGSDQPTSSPIALFKLKQADA